VITGRGLSQVKAEEIEFCEEFTRSDQCHGGALGCQHHFPFCLILITHFHKNASFRPDMLTYLNKSFTFGKQTKDNFINRKVQCRRTTHSFTHFRARFSFGESRECSSPRRTRNTSRSTAISDSSAGSTPRRYQANLEMESLHLVLARTLGRFPVGVDIDCSLNGLVRYSFLGQFAHMA